MTIHDNKLKLSNFESDKTSKLFTDNIDNMRARINSLPDETDRARGLQLLLKIIKGKIDPEITDQLSNLLIEKANK